ncbi:glycosyltransferase family 2 protein [Hyunsoonleella flava]|uniref:Glycosyltransferase family 2 protein n=1 Tax=Hyunsoonleella flava TaxID=2527939 RepID=A0A4Q9FIE3_9FLAO|nr:glycosyltransferase family A protein [Hyunsoonleella flava]TBN05623.1 glycosyltransferase family 2 protein [Hyunsoonleella flava]
MKASTLEHKLGLEILVSTMDRSSLSFLDNMFPHHDLRSLNILIINQTTIGQELTSNQKNIRVINSYDKGLSKSRNLALENAIGDICLIADDDVEYVEGFENAIKNSFSKLKTISVVLFKIKTFDGNYYKGYPQNSKLLSTKKELAKSSSIEIAFRREDIEKHKIRFNTLFGLGSQFPSGEEYLFLRDVHKHKMNVFFENTYIVKHERESSTSKVESDSFLMTKGAIYYIDYNLSAYFFAVKYVLFLLRKGKITLGEIFRTYFKIINGILAYKNQI